MDLSYSVDMIRLRMKADEKEFMPVMNKMQDLGSKKWIGYGYSSYKYNFTIEGINEGKTL